jgi:hypothetical protein
VSAGLPHTALVHHVPASLCVHLANCLNVMSSTVPAGSASTHTPPQARKTILRVIIGSSIRASAIHPLIPKGIGSGIPGQLHVTATRKQPIVARFTPTDTRLLLTTASTRASKPRRQAASTITQSSVTVQTRQHGKRRTPTVCRAGCLPRRPRCHRVTRWCAEICGLLFGS